MTLCSFLKGFHRLGQILQYLNTVIFTTSILWHPYFPVCDYNAYTRQQLNQAVLVSSLRLSGL